MQLWTRPLDSPVRNLVILCVAWKLLLLSIAALSPGPGYDTSASLFSPAADGRRQLPTPFQFIIGKLIRWDGIYYVKVADRGYVFEQEWAFGWGFTRLVSLCTAVLEKIGIERYNLLEGLVAIVIAHAAHILSVLVLYSLTLAVVSTSSVAFAFTIASLHIISPAGLFLSSPCAESSCALLSFAGCLLFIKSLGGNEPVHDILVVLSGVAFGIATTFRSNGILNGLLLLEEAFRTLGRLQNGLHVTTLRRLVATGLGGMGVGAGFLLPQYVAYSEYCGGLDGDMRPWCTRSLPSIYTFVQDHYWNVGLFRYWTLPNLPLFLLAAPMFALLIASGFWALKGRSTQPSDEKRDVKITISEPGLQVLRNLAASQLLLVLLTSTTAHVQIITRISSAFPVWLWYTASLWQRNTALFGRIVTYMVMYAIIQGGLFASFLPPA